MYKIGVIVDRESVLAFSALGMDVFAVSGADEAAALLRGEGMAEYAVIFITEDIAAGCMPAVNRHRTAETPAVILIPGKGGSLGIAMGDVRKSIEKAVGADIF